MGSGTGRRLGLVVATALVTLVVLAAGLASPAGAQTSSGQADSTAATQPSPHAGRVGMVNHMFWYDVNTVTATYQSMVDAGVRHTREDFVWNFLEPQNDSFEWSRSDNVMTAAARTGMDVLAILDYSAAWASSSGTNTQAYPATNTHYADFARRVAQRYGPGGSFWSAHPELTPSPIRALEIWNEPSGFWNAYPNPDPARYASMSLAAAQAIHGVNADIEVLIDGSILQARTDGQLRSWIEAVLAAQPTLKDHIDGYSVHPYPYPAPQGPYVEHEDVRWDYGVVELVRSRTQAMGAAKPIYITEVGWSTAPQGEGVTSEATQAQYISGAIRRATNEWSSFVPRVYVYSFDRDSNDPTEREGYFGVRRRDGTYKPAWDVIRELLAPVPAAEPAPTPAQPPAPLPPDGNGVVLGTSRLAVKVLGTVMYYDLAR